MIGLKNNQVKEEFDSLMNFLQNQKQQVGVKIKVS